MVARYIRLHSSNFSNRKWVSNLPTLTGYIKPGKVKKWSFSVETISAGGGRAPGHHEGGGLTVEVTKPGAETDDADGAEAEVKREVQERKKQERKTLNFFFTW